MKTFKQWLKENDSDHMINKLKSISGTWRPGSDGIRGIHQLLSDPDLKHIHDHGKKYYSGDRKTIKMRDGECHWNVSKLHDKKKIDHIVVGYAQTDRGWHQHTWGLKNDKVVETTPYDHENTSLYFGHKLSDNDANKFKQLTKNNPPGKGMVRTKKGGKVINDV